jgi:hypothetical protein
MLYKQLSPQIVNDVDFSEFIVRYQHNDEVLKSMFTMSCLCLLGCVMTGLHYRYDELAETTTDFWICLGFVAVVVTITVSCIASMDMFTKARLSVARTRQDLLKKDLVKNTVKKAATTAGSKEDGSVVHTAPRASMSALADEDALAGDLTSIMTDKKDDRGYGLTMS